MTTGHLCDHGLHDATLSWLISTPAPLIIME
jgi:hypothetical protein